MKAIGIFFFTLLFSPVLHADSTGSLSFAPPASDYSVVFLGNIFGVVDGVLHGTGSQIMGQMFGVFNAAILSVGGILLLYTVIVSTLNSAHQGQAFGQSWSSLWTPLRVTVGIGLLIPKSSGYCVMQIFVMWLVLQGVGAADKVWDAALSYLNRGGVIIQPQAGGGADSMGGMRYNQINVLVNPDVSNQPSDTYVGATNILAGQVCMLALQQLLETWRQQYLDSASQGSTSPCTTPDAKTDVSSSMYVFCNTVVPNFINSVDIYSAQSNKSTCAPDGQSAPSTTYSVCMPDFSDRPEGDVYKKLTGVCGVIGWNSIQSGFSSDQITNFKNNMNLSQSEYSSIEESRALAVYQMYSDLQAVAYTMVNNDPEINTSVQGQQPVDTNSPWAIRPFGVAMSQSQNPTCTTNQSDNMTSQNSDVCNSWGSTYSNASAALSGIEIQNALLDYNGLMQPTLNLMYNSLSVASATAFITDAETKGWAMAGSYFFDLAMLNHQASYSQQDTKSGLSTTSYKNTVLTDPFEQGCNASNPYYVLCQLSENNRSRLVDPITRLMNGTDQTPTSQTNPLPSPAIASLTSQAPLSFATYLSNTVFGYNYDATMLVLPGQPGMNIPIFYFNMPMPFVPKGINLSQQSWSIGYFNIPGDIVSGIYNKVIRVILQKLINFVLEEITLIIMLIFFPFIFGLALLFYISVLSLDNPTVSPIIGLANMGNRMINLSAIFAIAVGGALTGLASVLIVELGAMVLSMFLLPVLLATAGVAFATGLVLAFYIPMLPFLIFTFGVIAWLIQVIEAMVAAPIVALGVTYPEGHDVFGKGEQGIMMLLNVFLRPSMMIVGFITAISLSYVGVWILNAGFNHYVTQMYLGIKASMITSILSFFFLIIIYTGAYMTIAMKAFEMIHILPDKVSRWISGAQQESFGGDSARMADSVKGEFDKGAKGVSDSFGNTGPEDTDKENSTGKGPDATGSSGGKTELQSGTSSKPSPSPAPDD